MFTTTNITPDERTELHTRLKQAVGDLMGDDSDEGLVDGLFELMKKASKHTVAHVLAVHGPTVTQLMRLPCAYL